MLLHLPKTVGGGSNSGSSTFTGLTDTPSSLGTAGQVDTMVNSGGTALEFIDVPSSATTSEWSITSNGSSDYRFTGRVDGTENDPTIYLVEGQQYKFTNNSGGSHPFQIRATIDRTAYNDGITNNGLSSGTLTWDIQMDAPNILYYQCTSRSLGMFGKILIPNLGDGDNVSIKDFGAVGDGVADDTTAIQNAIDSGAKHLTFPPGTYKLMELLASMTNCMYSQRVQSLCRQLTRRCSTSTSLVRLMFTVYPVAILLDLIPFH